MGFNAKDCRHIATRLLQLADALDAGKVHVVQDRPYIEHDFVQPIRGRLFDLDDSIDLSHTIKSVRCKHDLELFAFHLAGAYCEISKEFIINDDRSKMLVEKMRYLQP